ncbi:MAG TPA: DUF488 domain-containing protein [Candidatus Thermoplasmatota archaeon]|nr:DUF488 domain-containing protein [Candidatus Thermoplasmatota archaeon]
MMKESYISKWKDLPAGVVKVRVARPSVLAPSEDLFHDYKEGRIDWRVFEQRFRKEMRDSSKAVAELQRLKALSRDKDVYLICYEKSYPCHRFILLDLINELP